MIGGGIVRLLFPDRLGKGLDPVVLTFLIPLWCLGISGILLLLVGWIRYPDLQVDAGDELPRRPDGHVFTPATRWLTAIVFALIWLSALTLWTLTEKELALWLKWLVFYCMTAYCWFVVYLSVLYHRDKHPATATYLDLFTPLAGFPLIPLTWPLLFALNRSVRNRRSARVS